MADIVLGILPIFLIILLGFGLRHRRFVPDTFWPPAEKLTYYVTFPALLIHNLAGADLAALAAGPLALVMALTVLSVAGATALVGPRLMKDGAAFSSVFQATIRPNTYVGLAAAAALYGEAGVTLTALCIVVVVPMVNLLSVLAIVLSVPAADGSRLGPRQIVRPLVTNPLILSCAVGAAINLAGGLPPVAGPLLEILGRASLPIALLAVGAGLRPGALGAARGPLLSSAAVKLLISPAVAFGLAHLLGLTGTPAAVAVLYAALPISVSSYVLARQLGGDATLVANITTVQTVLAAATLPLVAILLTS